MPDSPGGIERLPWLPVMWEHPSSRSIPVRAPRTGTPDPHRSLCSHLFLRFSSSSSFACRLEKTLSSRFCNDTRRGSVHHPGARSHSHSPRRGWSFPPPRPPNHSRGLCWMRGRDATSSASVGQPGKPLWHCQLRWLTYLQEVRGVGVSQGLHDMVPPRRNCRTRGRVLPHTGILTAPAQTHHLPAPFLPILPLGARLGMPQTPILSQQWELPRDSRAHPHPLGQAHKQT